MATMNDMTETGQAEAHYAARRRVWSFVRRNRVFLFSKRRRPGVCKALGYNPGEVIAWREDPAGLMQANFAKDETDLVNWIVESKCLEARASQGDRCLRCSGRMESEKYDSHMMPGVLDEKPDGQPDPFPWVGLSHLGCMPDPTPRERMRAQDDDEVAGLTWMRNRKLREGSCYKCTRPVTVDTLRDFTFDHLDPLLKSFGIGYAAVNCTTGAQVALLDEEADKCKLICRACNPARTAKQWDDEELYRGIHADRAAQRMLMPLPDGDGDNLLARTREANISLDTEKEYTRLYCGAQLTNWLGDKRPYDRQPVAPDRDAIRRVMQDKWDAKHPPPSPTQASKRAKHE